MLPRIIMRLKIGVTSVLIIILIVDPSSHTPRRCAKSSGVHHNRRRLPAPGSFCSVYVSVYTYSLTSRHCSAVLVTPLQLLQPLLWGITERMHVYDYDVNSWYSAHGQRIQFPVMVHIITNGSGQKLQRHCYSVATTVIMYFWSRPSWQHERIITLSQ